MCLQICIASVATMQKHPTSQPASLISSSLSRSVAQPSAKLRLMARGPCLWAASAASASVSFHCACAAPALPSAVTCSRFAPCSNPRSLQKRVLFECFPYVCPEPVLVK
jgi:hypothetical protein